MALTGCAVVGSVPGSATPVAGLNAISIISTDKTIVDHIVSFARRKNCSSVRVELGQTYCEEDEPTVEDEVFCFATLGDVSCYANPEPYAGDYKSIGHKPAAPAKKR